MDTPQDVLINCSSFPTDDIEIVHNEKPRMSLTTLENAIGTNFNELPNVQKNILSMIFSKTTEVSKLKPCFEKVELIEHPDPLQDSGEDLTTEDYPDIKILREDSSKQLPPNKIYENMFSLYDPTCNFGCERELLCGKTELELTNPTERESDMWVFEIGRCNVKDYPEEPLIGVISLYADQTKLTENFYVDLNPGHTKSYADEIPLEDHNKFCVIFKRKDLFKQESIKIKAIMLVYKIAELDPVAARDAYVQTDKKKKQTLDKLQFKRKRLYKQFLCVGSYDVSEAFKDEKSFGPKTLSMYREDIEKKSDLENFLTIDPTTRSLKQVIISCSLKAKRITTRTTTGVQKMIQNPQKDYFIKDHNGFEVQQSCSTGTPIQLLENFTHITMFKHFFMDFTNNIYISPRELNIASISSKDKKKTKLMITVYFRCSDRDLHDPSTIIPSFYSRITYEQDFVTSVSTTVSIGSKVDSYVDEIKAKLPVNLTDQHHLFFLIEDVAFDEEKRLEDPKKYYAYRPLFEQGKLIESGEFELPVYSIREATGYMTSTTKTIDSVGEKKSFLKVGIDIHSSLFAQDKKLYFLLDRICNKSSIKDIEKAMEPIDKIKVVPLMHFFPVIMRSFFNMYNVDIPQPQTSNVTVAVKPIDIKPSRLSIGNRVIEKNSPEKIMRTEPENKNFRSSVQLDTSRPSSGSFSSKKSDIVEHKDKPTDDHVFIFILKFFRSLLKDEDRVAKDFDKPRCRHPIFVSYTDFYFTNSSSDSDDPVDIPIFQKLTTSLSTFFENGVKQKSQKINDQQTQLVDIALEYGWVFFNIIIKSLTLDLGKRKIFSSQHRLDEIHSLFELPEYSTFNKSLVSLAKNLSSLIRIRLANGMTKGLFYVNADFTLFMSELLRIYSHTISFEVMVTYLNSISRYYDKTTQTLFLPKGQSKPSNLNTSTTPIDTSEQARCWNAVELLRVDILSILSSFEYFYQVNIPALIKPNSFQSIGKLRSILNERHYLSTLIELSELRLLSRVDSINTFTLSVLLKRIIMFDIDKKFQNQKESIAQMFFPLVMYFIDNEKQLKETWFDPSMEAEKQDFYVCFLWVLKNINRDILKQYIKQEVVSKIHTFVDIIETAMDILKSGLNKKERHQKKYQSLAECYLEERRKRITDICSMFKLDDTEKAKMLGEIPTLNEQEKQPSRPVNPKVSGKPPQGQNQFVPSPGLGSTLAIEKSLLKLQAKFGIEMTQNVEVIVPDPIRDNILYDDSLLVMLDVVECIFEGLFDRQDVDEMKKITDFITNKMFVNPPPAEYIKRFFQFIRKIIRTHGDYLFKDNLDFTFKLLKGIISYCNSKNQIIRVDATSVFYLFTRTNYVILGSTQCTRIHAIASLAETEPSSSSPSKGDHSTSKNSYFKRCCNTLDQWARLDFSQEKFHGKKNNDAQAEVVDIIDVNAFETYRNNVIKRRLSLLKFINKEQNGGDRKWRTKERVIRQLENLWKEDPVDEVMEKTNQLLESCKVQVQAELTIGGLKTSSVECARNFLEYVRNSIALVGEHSMDDKIYDQHVQTNNEKLNSLYNEYVQLSKKLQEVGSAVIVHSDGLNELLELTSMLLDSRKNITEEETNVRKERTEKINEFEQELKQTSVELVKSYTDACSQLITSSGEVINLTKSQQQLNQTIVKLNALTELAKKHHENFLNKEKEVFSISPWATIFKNWNNVLPISVYVLEQTTRFQNQLNTHEKETFEANEQMDIELSASEELVKSYAWEIAVQDVLDFVIGTHPSNDIVVIAGKLNQRFRSINASYKQIKQQSSLQTSTENGQSEKHSKCFLNCSKIN